MTAVLLKQRGDQISHYRLQRLLGAGCEGDVYLAVDMRSAALRTVKVLRGRNMMADAQHTAAHYRRLASIPTVKRFREWGVLTGQLGVGVRPWLAFDYIRGETLAKRIEERRIRNLLGILIAVCDALRPVHQRGYAIGDFDLDRNLLVERGTGLIRFCDLDAGGPREPLPTVAADGDELEGLARRLWRARGQKPDRAVLAVINDSRDAIEAGRRLRRLRPPTERPP